MLLLRPLRQTLAVLLASATPASAIDGTWAGLVAEWFTAPNGFGAAVSDTATFQHRRARTPLYLLEPQFGRYDPIRRRDAGPLMDRRSFRNAASCGNRGVSQFLASIMIAGIPIASRAMTAFCRPNRPPSEQYSPYGRHDELGRRRCNCATADHRIDPQRGVGQSRLRDRPIRHLHARRRNPRHHSCHIHAMEINYG
jgi:hypothetical protein